MVVAYGGGAYETHSAALKKLRIAESACTHKQSFGILNIGGGNFVTIAGPCSVETEEQIITGFLK